MRNADTGIIFDKRVGVVDPFKDFARHNNLRHAVSQSVNNAVLTAVIDEQHRLVEQLIEIPPRCDMDVAIVGCFVPAVMLPFGIGIFCTSIGDGCAGLCGQLIRKYNPKVYRKKSLWGTLINFAVSSLSALVMSLIFGIAMGQQKENFMSFTGKQDHI